MGKKKRARLSLSERQARKRLRPKKLVVATFDDDGSPICVVRPDRPDVAIQLTEAYLARPQREKDALWDAHIAELHEKAGPYEFVGYYSLNKDDAGENILVDPEDGEYVGVLRKGDMFCHDSSIEEIEVN